LTKAQKFRRRLGEPAAAIGDAVLPSPRDCMRVRQPSGTAGVRCLRGGSERPARPHDAARGILCGLLSLLQAGGDRSELFTKRREPEMKES
jgi:hypothetical protein